MTDFTREINPHEKQPEEIQAYIRSLHGPGDPGRFALAKKYKQSVFWWVCKTHGDTEFSVKHGTCNTCRKSKRSLARAARQKHYLDNCEKHGEALHRVDTANCQQCRDENPRGKKPTLRSFARRQGQTTYLEVCPVHGVTAYGVLSGKCLTCYNSVGAPRPGPPAPLAPRALARRQGLKTYMAPCETHGVVPHDVARGKCQTCFTTIGAPRKRPA